LPRVKPGPISTISRKWGLWQLREPAADTAAHLVDHVFPALPFGSGYFPHLLHYGTRWLMTRGL
jgi:hypothetical protein